MTARPRRVERRHLAERRRGAQHGSRRHPRTTSATTAPTSSWRSCSGIGTAWDDDASIVDKVSGRFAGSVQGRATGLRRSVFAVARAIHVPRTPQGRPVVIQAGQSGRGRRFAGRWAEVIFTSAPTLATAQAGLHRGAREIAAAGRDPDDVKVCNLVMPVAAASRAEAEDKMAVLLATPRSRSTSCRCFLRH